MVDTGKDPASNNQHIGARTMSNALYITLMILQGFISLVTLYGFASLI
jgi:hypothetical protein